MVPMRAMVWLMVLSVMTGVDGACDSDNSPADSVFRTPPGRYDLGCRGQNLETNCCVKEGRKVTWQERVPNTTQWLDLDTSKSMVVENGQRLVLTDRNESLLEVKCHVEGTDHSVVKLITYTRCNECTRGKITYPAHDITSIDVLPGSRTSFTFQVFVGCSNREEVMRKFGLMRRGASRLDVHSLVWVPLERHNVSYIMNGGNLQIRVTIDPVVVKDYAYKYILSNRNEGRIYNLVEKQPEVSVYEKPDDSLVIPPIVVPALLPCLIVLMYLFRLSIRLSCRSFMSPDANTRVLFINATDPVDEQYIERHLLPDLVSLGLNVRTNYRDFLVGGNEDEEFSAEVNTCARIIILLSNNFLREKICNRAFELANGSDNSKIVFLCAGDLTDWDPVVHDLLKRRLEVAGRFYSPCRKLVCPAEAPSGGAGLLAALKKLKHSRDVDFFKKRLRLAMPLTELDAWRWRRFEVTNPLQKWNRAYGRQDSMASDVVLHV